VINNNKIRKLLFVTTLNYN